MTYLSGTKPLVTIGATFLFLALLGVAPAGALDPVAEPAAPVAPPDVAEERKVAPPDEVMILPVPYPETTSTTPPMLPSENFGIGWPAVVAVTIALLAVLAMALVWRRDELR